MTNVEHVEPPAVQRMTSEELWELLEPRITSDKVWKLVEPRINEYWRIAKWVVWIVLSILSATLFAIFTIESVRDGVILSLIKIEKLFDEKGKKALGKEMEEQSDVLYKIIEKYIKSDKPTSIFDTANDLQWKKQAVGAFDTRFWEKMARRDSKGFGHLFV